MGQQGNPVLHLVVIMNMLRIVVVFAFVLVAAAAADGKSRMSPSREPYFLHNVQLIPQDETDLCESGSCACDFSQVKKITVSSVTLFLSLWGNQGSKK